MSPHTAPVVQGDGEPTPAEITEARAKLQQELNGGALVVSARLARKLAAGFDGLVDYIAQGETRAEKAGLTRIGLVMHRLGVTDVTITEADMHELAESGATLKHTGDEHAITFRLEYPAYEPEATNAAVEGEDVPEDAAA